MTHLLNPIGHTLQANSDKRVASSTNMHRTSYNATRYLLPATC